MNSLSLAVEQLEEGMDSVDRFLGMDAVDGGMSLGGKTPKGGGGKGEKPARDPYRKTSGALSKFLRHDVDLSDIDSSGRVRMDVAELELKLNAEDIRNCIMAQTEQRMGMETDGGVEYVFCYQGHDNRYFDSENGPIQRNLIYKALPASFGYALFHSTKESNVESINTYGLRPAKRDVHMFASNNKKKGRLSALSNALFKVNFKFAIRDGFEFWVAGNGVILCENVIPPRYLHCTVLAVNDGVVEEPDWENDPKYCKP